MKKWTVGIGIGLAIAALLVVGLALGGGHIGRGRYWPGPSAMMGSTYGTMHTLGGGIFMMLFWGAVIGGLVLLVAGLGRKDDKPVNGDIAPLDILKRRYANGEIDHEEFERIKESLSS